ncbi:MAG: restriction endonuclease subunit S, partial [Chitinophagaceae bacterium]|nr:restriction endonuclease subunit S [Chitinophagaceae bacterium]
MSSGRKKKIDNSNSTWEQIFNKNVGRYLQTIIAELANQNNDYAINDSASSLLNIIKTINTKKYPEIPDSDIPFRIPTNWVWCRLGEICTKIGSGSTPNGSNYSDEGIPFFRSQNIHNEGLVYDDINFISTEIHQKMKGTTVYPNDILLNITGGSLGRCALVPIDFFEGNVSQHVCIIRPISVNNAFYHKIILSPFFQQFVFSSTTGSGREGLPKYNLEQFLIPLPTIQEQNNIIGFLNDFETENLRSVGSYFNANVEQKIIDLHNSQLVNSDLSNELTHQLSLVKKLRQQLLQDAVQGKLVPQDKNDEPASELLKRIKAEKAKDKKYKELPAIKPEEIPFEIPDNWVWCRLGEVITLISGQDLTPSEYSDNDNSGIPYITGASNLKEGKVIINRWTNKPKSLAINGDLLLTCKGSGIGKMGILDEREVHIARQIMAIRSHWIPKTFLKFFIELQVDDFRRRAKSLIPGIDRDIVLSLIFPLSPLEEQNRIVNKLDE